MKKTVFGLCCALAVVYSATSFAGNVKEQLNYASTKDIQDINPHLYSGEMAAQSMVFEPLVLNTDEGIKPNLAKSWEIGEDGRTYTFHLRDDVTFTDGVKFNAHTAKQNFDVVLKNGKRHGWIELVNQIESVTAADDFTLVLQLKHPYYPTLVELGLTRPFRFISPNSFKEGDTKFGVNSYIGTGQWILSEHKDGQYALFERNEHYWGEKPAIKRINWRVIPDHQTILLGLEKGNIDLIFGADGDMIDMDSFNALKNNKKFVTQLSNPIGSRAMVLNSRQPILSDKKVRVALQYAIDKEGIAEGVLNGTETVADTLMARTTPYSDVEQKVYHYSLDTAQALLDEAGWLKKAGETYRQKEGQPLKINISYNNLNASEQSIAEVIQSDLKNIGIAVELIGEETNAYLDRQKKGNFDIQFTLSWGTPYDPQSFVSSFRIPSHADYQGQIGLASKPHIDQMINDVLIEADETKRQAIYAELFGLLAEEAVYIPLTYSKTKVVHIPALKGVTFNPSQYEIPFEKMYFATK